ncbi:flagellar biosynthetic protein FliR [Marinimicrococcus flavescens]|uniref:Flagellar biosynthetic protein FliR n=1 Tax=Marinimicrococcus flavescens TaxID=3031815 RepID=A0AAP3XQ78_9PROT|nr:flagellar biosynthetic protein FliR [Marinimicrococcus flavescens]
MSGFTLEAMLQAELAGTGLLFARIGSALMVLPLLGEAAVTPRLRLFVALALSLLLRPVLAHSLPPLPEEPVALAALVGGEIVIGLLLGSLGRLAMAAVHVAANVVAYQSGLAAAALFDPNEAQPVSPLAQFLGMAALTAILAADGHHAMLLALRDGYERLPPGAPLPFGEAAGLYARLAASTMEVGLRMAAPVLLAGLLVNVAVGLAARLVPSLQVFLLFVPAQILIAFAVAALSLGTVLALMLRHFEGALLLMAGG